MLVLVGSGCDVSVVSICTVWVISILGVGKGVGETAVGGNVGVGDCGETNRQPVKTKIASMIKKSCRILSKSHLQEIIPNCTWLKMKKISAANTYSQIF